MTKITVQQVIQDAIKEKPVSVKQIKTFADANYKEVGISKKTINQFLYNEYYDESKLYSNCEPFERFI